MEDWETLAVRITDFVRQKIRRDPIYRQIDWAEMVSALSNEASSAFIEHSTARIVQRDRIEQIVIQAAASEGLTSD